MNLERTERRQLMTRARWRLPALPAGKNALLRGLAVVVLLLIALLPIVPFGPEMVGNTAVLASPTSLEPPIQPALSAYRTMVSLLSLGLHPFVASSSLSVLLLSLCCGVTLFWLRQQDVARSVVVLTALLLGLSPAITELARYGGSVPLSMLFGICLIASTEQLRSEAGRGIGTCGIAAGLAIGSGPLVIPALLYSLLSLICDQSIRDLRLRSLLWGFGGLLFGFAILISVATISDPAGIYGVVQGFVSDWTPRFDVDLTQITRTFALVTTGTGVILGSLAILGILYGIIRRPGDLALVLTMASSGPLLSSCFRDQTSSSLYGAPPFLHGWIIFSLLTMTLLASWTVTVTHRRLGKSRARAKQWLLGALLILVVMSLAMRSPSLLKPRSEVVTQWAQSVLLSVPQDALLLSGGSPLGKAISVIQLQRGIRPDVILLDRSGNLDPLLIGLSQDTSEPQTLQAARALVTAGRPLVALPMALHHPLLSGRQLSPWGLVLIAHDGATPAPDDNRAWTQIDIPDLPVDPAGAWHWIRGDGPARFASGSMASEVAAASWFAMARRQGQLRGDGRWGAILGLLGRLIEDPAMTREWARQQPADLVTSDATSPAPRISD